MDTLLLDRTRWDLVSDAAGNIAVASDPYSIAQDVASAARLFRGELWYNTARGIPYFGRVLGGVPPPLSVLKALLAGIARTVPGVAAIKVFLQGIGPSRLVTGQIQITTTAGELLVTEVPLALGTPLTDELGNVLTDENGNPLYP